MSVDQQKKAIPGARRSSNLFEKLVNFGMHSRWESEAEYEARKRTHPEQFHCGWAPLESLNQRLLRAEAGIKDRFLGIHGATTCVSSAGPGQGKTGPTQNYKMGWRQSQTRHSQKKGCVTRQHILDVAAKWAGTPYGHGMQVPGVSGDCSGTVLAIYSSVGIQIQLGAMPSGSSAQGIFNSPSLSQTTSPKPGDIVYWSKPYNHTMIFSGDDKAWGARSPGKVFGNWPMSWFGNGTSPTYLTSSSISDE